MNKAGIILLLLVFTLLPAIAKEKAIDEINYEIEGAGVGTEGSYLVKVWVISKKSKLSDDEIAKCAVRGVLFRGFANKEMRISQKPLAGSGLVEQQHKDFFNDFFRTGGTYRNYVSAVTNSLEVVKSGKVYKIGAIVTVQKEQLRKDLEGAGIIKGLNTGF